MYICICHVVTRTQIESVIRAGAKTVDEVGAASTAGTDCGKCRRNIARLIDLCAQAEPPAPVPSEAR